MNLEWTRQSGIRLAIESDAKAFSMDNDLSEG